MIKTVLVLGLLLSLAAPAAAQLARAEMVVGGEGRDEINRPLFGFIHPGTGSPSGSLDPSSFAFGGQDYEVTQIEWNPEIESLVVVLYPHPTEKPRPIEEPRVWIDGISQGAVFDIGELPSFYWYQYGPVDLDWSVGQRVTVSIGQGATEPTETLPVPALPFAGVLVLLALLTAAHARCRAR